MTTEMLLPDPSPRLVAAFAAAAKRMEGLDFVNLSLAVEAVDFAPWEGHWLGVLVTPWFMTLMLAPRDPSRGRTGRRLESLLHGCQRLGDLSYRIAGR